MSSPAITSESTRLREHPRLTMANFVIGIRRCSLLAASPWDRGPYMSFIFTPLRVISRSFNSPLPGIGTASPFIFIPIFSAMQV